MLALLLHHSKRPTFSIIPFGKKKKQNDGAGAMGYGVSGALTMRILCGATKDAHAADILVLQH